MDEAGPFQTVPYPGSSWQPEGKALRYPHEYVRDGTAKMMTLFHPADGQVRVMGVESCTNPVLHGWLRAELEAVLAGMPQAEMALSPEENRRAWQAWQEGLTVRISLREELPPLRMLLVLDNLSGHKSVELVLWLFDHGIMPLYTPLGGSWLNMTESVQRIIKRRALDGQHPRTTGEIIDWLEAAARGWNREPTPFQWGGSRRERRQRARERRHRLGGSGAYIRMPLPAPAARWPLLMQMTH
ncbi:MAG: transposase [Bacteroidetes bacterium]|nr:transposase [Bacteroidota bacterium]